MNRQPCYRERSNHDPDFEHPRTRIYRNAIERAARTVLESLAETAWPTRCAICDEPGETICKRCRLLLPFIDAWKACPRCGAPYGSNQCTECNPVTLGSFGRTEPSYDRCASAVLFTDQSARIVRAWKDAGERNLAMDMASFMMQRIPPAWKSLEPAIVPIPASRAALRRRGYDHGLELAAALAELTGLETLSAFERPSSKDQRMLGRTGRLSNMRSAFRIQKGQRAPRVALVVDDVFTTGSTIMAASDALKESGSSVVLALTFARVW